jgi:hypothetical protein
MKYRKLRIAWSAICGIMTVLLIVLWARSFWRSDSARYRGSAVTRMVVSENGVAYVGEWYPNQSPGWKFSSTPVTEPIVSIRQQLAVAYFDERPRDVCLAFPHWLLLLPFAILTVAPWLNWHFRVRTLLIITTAVAALLGLVAWASH